jgi:hypothetical protein
MEEMNSLNTSENTVPFGTQTQALSKKLKYEYQKVRFMITERQAYQLCGIRAWLSRWSCNKHFKTAHVLGMGDF